MTVSMDLLSVLDKAKKEKENAEDSVQARYWAIFITDLEKLIGFVWAYLEE